MIKRTIKIFIVFAFLIFTANHLFADGDQPPSSSNKSGNFSKKSFSSKNAWSNNGKSTGAIPTPGSSGTGDKIPISNGLLILIAGSLIFISKRVHKEQQ